MHDLLIFITGAVVIFAGWNSLVRTRDPLSPMVVFAPMLLYMFVYNPWSRLHSRGLPFLFRDREELLLVHVVYLLGVAAFCAGLSLVRVSRTAPDRRFELLPGEMTSGTRRKLFRLACVLGLVANFAFWFMVYYSGGWATVFSQSKPFLKTPSGYIGELPMLVYPGMLLLAAAWQGRKMSLPHAVMFLLIAMPQLMMATFGGRRGPMFLVVCALGACWCIVNSRRPKTRTILVGAGLLGLVLMLLGGNRSGLFKPWENEIDFTVVADRLAPVELQTGDEYVAGSAMIIATNQLGRHYWGLRYLTTFVVRPIPSFLWPSKYRDMGMGWMQTSPGSSGILDSEWLAILGFVPASGNAGGFIPDLFVEFSWAAILFCFLIGRLYSSCWKRWRTRGGLWALLYFELLILSLYLPSQSVGAWLYRMMLLGVPTWLIWRNVILPGTRVSYRRPVVGKTRLRATQS